MNSKIQSTPAKPAHTSLLFLGECVMLSSYLSIISLAVLHLRFSVDVHESCCNSHRCILFILFNEVSAQDFPQCLVTAALSFYQALKKILYSVVEEIDLDLHGVNYLSFGLCSVLHSDLHCYLFLATSLVCFGVNALTQCHNRTKCASLTHVAFFGTLQAPFLFRCPTKMHSQRSFLNTTLMDSW